MFPLAQLSNQLGNNQSIGRAWEEALNSRLEPDLISLEDVDEIGKDKGESVGINRIINY